MPDARAGHAALLYRDGEELHAWVVPFVRDGADAGQDVLVVGARPRLLALRERLGDLADRVAFESTGEGGAALAGIAPCVREFATAHADRPARFVGEAPLGRAAAPGRREAMRHEALIDLLLAKAPVTAMCAYDAGRLRPPLAAEVARAHQVVLHGGPAGPGDLLPAPPAGAELIDFSNEAHLLWVRQFAALHASWAGIGDDRVADLQRAVGELAMDALRRSGAGGSLVAWRAGAHLVCQISDAGPPCRAPLGGLGATEAHLRSLRLVGHLCDPVEVRASGGGTVVRVHMRIDDPGGAAV